MAHFLRSSSTLVTLALLTLAPPVLAQQSPRAVASAGVDPNTGDALHQATLFIGPSDTGIAHTISGAGSYDPDGDALSYKWTCTDQATEGKCIFLLGVAANQVNFRPTFPPGTFDVTLTVDDGEGHTSSDSVRVRVSVDMTPPVVTPPDDESISATEAGGVRGSASSKLHDFLFNSAKAVDNSTVIFSHLPPQIGGADVDDSTLIPHGTTVVTFRIADVHGNIGSATANVFVTDLREGDLFVGVGPSTYTIFGFQSKGLIQRIRDGVVTDYCQSPEAVTAPVPLGQPVYWRRPDQIVVDSKGRVAFLAPLHSGNGFNPAPQNGWGLFRCNQVGQPPERLAIFPQGSYIDPGWPVPLPGRTFYGGTPLTGLHLRKTKRVVIDDNGNGANARVVTEERYVMAFQEDPGPCCGGNIGSLSFDTETLELVEDDLSPVAVGPLNNTLPSMFFHSKMEPVSFSGVSFSAPVAKTYIGGSGNLRRVLHPFELQVNATTPSGTVQFGVQAFSGFMELPYRVILDDVEMPNPPSGCTAPPGIRSDWPIRSQPGGGSYTSLDASYGLIFEQRSGLVINNASWFGHLDESLLDLDPANDRQAYFTRPETGCRIEPVINFSPLAGHGVLTAFESPDGYHWDANGGGIYPDKMAASPNGVFGTIAGSGRVVQATGARELVDVATGLAAPNGLGAFPPQVGSVHVSVVIIRIDSPVDVVVTDALGRRVGVLDGQPIDEFGGQAYDSGPATHPRLYLIRYPQPGSYLVRSAGTGSGPFTVHVYTVDSAKRVTQHLSHSGHAEPGSAGAHDFDLSAAGSVAFVNSPPIANAGLDGTVDAGATGTASVALDGSLSSDADGDALTFTWAGPFGVLSGAQPAATLGAGEHEITLTVSDGRGGVGRSTVHITVNGSVDAVAPASTATPSSPPNGAGWHHAPVTITMIAADNVGGSGVQQITYSVSGAQSVPATTVAAETLSVSIATDGSSVVSYFATDNAGNVEAAQTLNVNVDQTAPVLTALPDQAVTQTDANGAIVSFAQPAIIESGSGIASSSCVPASGSLFALGQTMVTCTAADGAGNTGSMSFTVTVTPSTQEPDGVMLGAGFIGAGKKRQHLVFRVAQIHNRDSGRFQYWQDQKGPPARFEATSIDRVVFGGGVSAAVSVQFSGAGKWNGQNGYTFEAAATDHGRRKHHRDTFSLIVKDARGKVVASVSGNLEGGTIRTVPLATGAGKSAFGDRFRFP